MLRRTNESGVVRIIVGSLVVPKFDNDFVILMNNSPNLFRKENRFSESLLETMARSTEDIKLNVMWKKKHTAVVIEIEFQWIRVLAPGGGLGWIGEWNIEAIE